jgi:hypothetical protein
MDRLTCSRTTSRISAPHGQETAHEVRTEPVAHISTARQKAASPPAGGLAGSAAPAAAVGP